MPIAFPRGLTPARMQWGLEAAVLRSPSLSNGSERVIARAGSRWTAVLGYEAMDPAQTRAMRAFLARLRGGAEMALIAPMMHPQPAGTLRGAPVVLGGGQTGRAWVSPEGERFTVLDLRDCQPGRTLLAGDFVGIDGQVHMIARDAMANTSGIMSIAIEPPRRVPPADGALVVWDRPTVAMRLTQSSWAQQFGAPTRPGWSSGLELQFSESWV